MAAKSTIRDLLALGDIASNELDDAVTTYLSDPSIPRFILGEGLRVDLGTAVRGDVHATAVLRDRTSMAGMRRHVVRRVLLDARTE